MIPPKLRARIMTVDPATRRIEGATKDGAMIQIAIWEVPSFFRWPQVGEWWTVTRQSGVWMLGDFMEEQDNIHKIEDTAIGEAKVNADAIKTASGNDVVITDQSSATTGLPLVWTGTAWITQQQHLTLVTSLPSNPTNGDICYFVANATNGIIWAFRYNLPSASSFKWEFVGGSPLFAEVTTKETTNSASYIDLTTTGPSITLPLAGDYMAHHGAHVERAGNVATRNSVTIKLGAAAASDLQRAMTATIGSTSNAADGASIIRTQRLPGRALGEILLLQYKVEINVVTTSFENRWIAITPTRVG